MSKLLFLTGIGRSGTTLLQQMLHAHSQIDFKPETHFFKTYILPQLLGKANKNSSLANIAKGDTYLNRLEKKEREQILELPNTKQALEKGFENLLTNRGLAYGADKDTEYVRYFPHLKNAYPDLSLINMLRDPRDVVLSRKKTPWGAKRSLVFHAAEYVYYFKKNRREGPNLFGERYHEVQFERLIENPKEEVTKVLNALGLTFEESVLDYAKHSNSLIAEDEKAWKGNADKPILKGNSNKWQTELDKGVIALIESEIGEEMQQLGYPLSGYKYNTVKKIEFKAVMAAFAYKSRKEALNG